MKFQFARQEQHRTLSRWSVPPLFRMLIKNSHVHWCTLDGTGLWTRIYKQRWAWVRIISTKTSVNKFRFLSPIMRTAAKSPCSLSDKGVISLSASTLCCSPALISKADAYLIHCKRWTKGWKCGGVEFRAGMSIGEGKVGKSKGMTKTEEKKNPEVVLRLCWLIQENRKTRVLSKELL